MPTCDVCHEPIGPDQYAFHHQRLALTFHGDHTPTDINQAAGEDITNHTLLFLPPRNILDWTNEGPR